MSARNVQTRMVRAGRLSRAFTLIEMLICVGAVALIAVGLGKLFSSTGDTVKIGKRISYFNEVAGSLERQIRRDLASATRDGPMVIRNKLIEDPTNPNPIKGVYLSADRNPVSARVRRADEIMFLAQGKFASNREPMWPGYVPSSGVARITIGHGMKSTDYSGVNVDTDPANAGLLPGGMWPAGLGKAGPNEYASDWILLRNVTVLARPQDTRYQVPANATGIAYLNSAQKWRDSPAQIKLQPAAPSVFRFDPLHPTEPDRLGFGYEEWAPGNGTPMMRSLPTPAQLVRTGNPVWPQAASGMVDVASIDPQMVRTRILGVPYRLPWNALSDPSRSSKMSIMNATTAALLSSVYTYPPGGPRPATFNSVHPMKMLMAAMLPGADPWIAGNGAVASPINPLNSAAMHEQRMLCAPVPPDFTGNLSGSRWPIYEPWRQQDQAMLSASNFAVGCSEFIVEWSFGDVYPMLDGTSAAAVNKPVGEIIWHGMYREADPVTHALAAAPYRGLDRHNDSIWSPLNPRIGYDLFTERWTRNVPNGAGLPYTPVQRRVESELIHWPANYKDRGRQFGADVPLYSFFGYVDPTYDPTAPPLNQSLGDPDTMEWPWPKLLRFTISLTDPTDPSVEQTFQFVVDLPAANRRQ